MRPDVLNPLFAETETLEGVGPKIAKPLEKLGPEAGARSGLPPARTLRERRAVANLDEASVGEQMVVPLTVTEHRASRNGRGPYRVLASDAQGNFVSLTYFGKASYTARKLLPVGEKRWVAGRLDQYGQMLQIVHPDHVGEDSAGLLGTLRSRSMPCPKG